MLPRARGLCGPCPILRILGKRESRTKHSFSDLRVGGSDSCNGRKGCRTLRRGDPAKTKGLGIRLGHHFKVGSFLTRNRREKNKDRNGKAGLTSLPFC